MAYRIAEHPEVMLPVNVCFDGNFLSYAAEPIEVVDQSLVDKFLGPKTPEKINWHVALDPLRPMGVDPLTGMTGPGGLAFAKYRQGHCLGMQNALKVIEEAHKDWKKLTGHDFAPLIEEYKMKDAEYAIMTIGSMTGAGKDAVDAARDQGKKVGLLKIKTFRPFPVKALQKAMSKIKALGVVDRSVSYGWNCGPLYQEVLAASAKMKQHPEVISFIGGLAGTDITIDHMLDAIDTVGQVAKGKVVEETIWMNEKF
jgi:pyruvate ferredoxin oxidoreductase alpha subunit/phenylglyoxylate dehydrogenase alpha subunit